MSATNNLVRIGEREENRCKVVNDAVALIGDKWTVMIVGVLGRQESIRYNELQRAVGGISQRMLTLRLKTLEENGLVKRTVFPSVPPRVDYELTALGQAFTKPLRVLIQWMIENRTEMAKASRDYVKATKKTH